MSMPLRVTFTAEVIIGIVAGVLVPAVLAARRYAQRERRRARERERRDILLAWIADRMAEVHGVEPPPIDVPTEDVNPTRADGGQERE